MKRIALLALCLALWMGSAQASMAVRMDEAAALLREDGGEIVPQGVYSDIVPLGEDLFAATREGERYALLDGEGRALSEEIYEELRLANGMLLGQRDGEWGLLDCAGAELSEFAYDAILPGGEGGFWALREEELMEIYALDASGQAKDTGLSVQRVGEAGEGLLPVLTEDGLWGYCDIEGRMAIPARYDWAGGFVCGCAAVVTDGGYGAIDRSGAWIVAAEWDFLEISPSGFLLLDGEDGARVCAADGNILAEFPGEDVWIALAGAGYMVGDEGSLRVFDASGALLEALPPDASVSDGVGGQLVISEGIWGEECVRLSGTEHTYQNLYPLGTAEGQAVYANLEARSARYQSDLLQEVQVSVDMDSARYGLVDGAGEVLLPGGYLSLQFLADDRFLARDEAQYRVINSWGKVYWRSNDAMRTVAPNS